MTDPGRLERQRSPQHEARDDGPSRGGGRDGHDGRNARWLQAGQLLAGLVHELKNPLAVVQGYGQLLLERAPDGSDEHEDVECLLAEVARVVRLVDDLQLYVRPGEELTQLDVAESLESAVALARHRLREARVRVEIELPHGVPAVWAPRAGLLHGFVTLLCVAADELQAAPIDARCVHVEARADERGVELGWSWPSCIDALPADALRDLELCVELLERGAGGLRVATAVGVGEPRRALVALGCGPLGEAH